MHEENQNSKASRTDRGSRVGRAWSRRLRHAVHPEGTDHRIQRQRVSWESAPNDDNDPHTFNFGLESGEVINPEIGGNDARWINHCCGPKNCEASRKTTASSSTRCANRTRQELFYDYALEIDEPITEELMQEFRMSLWRRMLPRHNARIEIKKDARA